MVEKFKSSNPNQWTAVTCAYVAASELNKYHAKVYEIYGSDEENQVIIISPGWSYDKSYAFSSYKTDMYSLCRANDVELIIAGSIALDESIEWIRTYNYKSNWNLNKMKVKVYSESGSGREYEIDTQAVTCTCPNFKFVCSRYPKDDESRLCKHLAAYYREHPETMPIELIKADQAKEEQAGMQADGKVRYLRAIFDPYVETIQQMMKDFPEVERFEICGSYRRKSAMVSDLDILFVLKEGYSAEAIFNYCENFLGYTKLWRGPIKAAYMADGFIHIDFKVVPSECWSFALLHFTGSKNENIRLRRRAGEMGLKLNEYGIFDSDENQVEGKFESEKDVYDFLSLQYKQPWER